MLRLAQLFYAAMADPDGALRVLAACEKRCAAKLVLFCEHLTHARRCHLMNNSITVVGHIGQNPHTKTFKDTGNKVVKFSVAVKEYSSNTDEERTMWIDVDAWNGLGDRVLKTITKGREVVIQGRLVISTYTKEVNGEIVQMMKPVIKLTSFHLCGRKPTAKDETQPLELRKAAPRKKMA